ncbi:MAG TPA: hypothetical protein VG457_06030 [Planctomycetota bacterium]|jgi:hypothetical protein|nr:hypothetical protein [Planctomycetota bacterium]
MVDGWPLVAGLMARVANLRNSWPALGGFSDRCLRGDPRADTLFLNYAHEMTETPNPRYGEEWTAFLDRLKRDPMPASRIAREGPHAMRRTFGEQGLRLSLRFDRGPARRLFPMLSICDFADSQISLMLVEGPPTRRFRTLEDALWGAVYEEVLRIERQAAGGLPNP